MTNTELAQKLEAAAYILRLCEDDGARRAAQQLLAEAVLELDLATQRQYNKHTVER